MESFDYKFKPFVNGVLAICLEVTVYASVYICCLKVVYYHDDYKGQDDRSLVSENLPVETHLVKKKQLSKDLPVIPIVTCF